ncbi:hypothetical protein AB0H18_14055 [Streptomyces sp. NPDC020766]|uniref:hypothetical protein n=1 Tax=Streptomyces sp. NPDC020766 TaxID=3155011 RepID=UPI0033EF3AAD
MRIGDRGPSNVLMAQNERDPGTPSAGALRGTSPARRSTASNRRVEACSRSGGIVGPCSGSSPGTGGR